jgi:hypothetical protein
MKIIITTIFLSLITGCSTFRSYKNESDEISKFSKAGQFDQALQILDSEAPSDRDLLYFMEKGELLRLKKSFPESIASWKQSDKKIAEWESEAKVTLSKVGSGVASAVVNDKSSRYDGQDYEKVMLSTRLALDHIALGDLDGARVEMRVS